MKGCAVVFLQWLTALVIIALMVVGFSLVPLGAPGRAPGCRALALAFFLSGLAGLYGSRHRADYVTDFYWRWGVFATVVQFAVAAVSLLVSFF